jgi:hypothetical protein
METIRKLQIKGKKTTRIAVQRKEKNCRWGGTVLIMQMDGVMLIIFS